MPREIQFFRRHPQRETSLPSSTGQPGRARNNTVGRNLPARDGGNDIPDQLERRILFARRPRSRARSPPVRAQGPKQRRKGLFRARHPRIIAQRVRHAARPGFPPISRCGFASRIATSGRWPSALIVGRSARRLAAFPPNRRGRHPPHKWPPALWKPNPEPNIRPARCPRDPIGAPGNRHPTPNGRDHARPHETRCDGRRVQRRGRHPH
jgi:hypothetical protein